MGVVSACKGLVPLYSAGITHMFLVVLLIGLPPLKERIIMEIKKMMNFNTGALRSSYREIGETSGQSGRGGNPSY